MESPCIPLACTPGSGICHPFQETGRGQAIPAHPGPGSGSPPRISAASCRGRNAVDFFFRKVCAVCPTAVPALAAIISVKQFLMERQELPIQLIRICMNLEEGSRTQIFIFSFRGGSVDIFWRNHSCKPHSRQISWVHYILFPSHAQEGCGEI